MEEVMTASKEEQFIQRFEQVDYSRDVDFSRQKREEAFQQLQEMRFPDSKTEYWKYTRLNRILKGNYRLYPEVKELPSLELEGKYRLVFLNGYFAEALSNLPEQTGVHCRPLSEMKGDNDILRSGFGSLSKDGKEIFATLNTAFHQDGACLIVDEGVQMEEPVHIYQITTETDALSLPRHFIQLGKKSSARLACKTLSTVDGAAFTNSLTEIIVDEEANLEYDKVQQDESQAYQISCEEVWQGANSRFKINTFTLGGQLVRNNLNIDLQGSHTETWLNGLYLLKGTQHVDNHTFVNHAFPDCVSHELYKGIIDEKATGVFNGKVFVNRIAQKTNAYQSNANVVLTDDAAVFSKPELEIYADDVKCSHGSTTGQLDDEALFYLRSRGMSERTARGVLLKAFANDVLEFISNDSIKEEVKQKIEEFHSII
jgi:Fe-S cluster assembly protein SufD